MGPVAVVTDSTADLPPQLIEELGIRVVPMSVTFRDRTYISRITITDDEFYARLASAEELPTTAQPAPGWFEEAYADAADEGCSSVVSIHVSAALSGTVSVARTMGEQAPLPVHVVDSRQVGSGLGLVVLAAHRVAAAGGSLEEVIAVAGRAGELVRSFVVVDTMDYLRRGGRLTGTQAIVGNVLRVKPILGIVEGRVEVLERTRTWSRAIDRVAALASDVADGKPVRIAVSDAVAPERAERVWSALEQDVWIDDRLGSAIGPVVGTHTGPGTVAVSVIPVDV
ncbi:MAG: DegV family protein [Actinobacteria bacterium]|nr:DegV family protein [Actinomycetota bacterium]